MRRYVRDSLAKVRRLCVDVGLVTPLTRRLWEAEGIWEQDRRSTPAPGGAARSG
jgi:hypothetical protein